jgi:hypothetical protein
MLERKCVVCNRQRFEHPTAYLIDFRVEDGSDVDCHDVRFESERIQFMNYSFAALQICEKFKESVQLFLWPDPEARPQY